VSDLPGRLIALTGEMRRRGARVGVGELLLAHRALGVVDPIDREDVRAALGCALCAGHADVARFEQAFRAVFGGTAGPDAGDLSPLDEVAREALPRAALPGPPPPSGAQREQLREVPTPAAWSEIELLLEKDFAELTVREAALAQQLIRRLAKRSPMRRSRRTRASRARRGHTPDLRRLLRDSLHTGGEPVHRAWRVPTERPRPVVLVCDVSGSMAPYARMLLQYLHACVAARRRVEAFAFATRLTRITHELSGRDHDRALVRAAAAVGDLSGGTRIGTAMAELNRVHGRRLGRGAVVVILSDGWDCGEPDLLGDEIARLRRSAHHLVWLNPLAAHPDYAPLTRGMQAAVPHVDRLLPGNSLASLYELAAILEEL
jgi:uncharacterized protein with von Willebrand factor type A (vWA) domain